MRRYEIIKRYNERLRQRGCLLEIDRYAFTMDHQKELLLAQIKMYNGYDRKIESVTLTVTTDRGSVIEHCYKRQIDSGEEFGDDQAVYLGDNEVGKLEITCKNICFTDGTTYEARDGDVYVQERKPVINEEEELPDIDGKESYKKVSREKVVTKKSPEKKSKKAHKAKAKEPKSRKSNRRNKKFIILGIVFAFILIIAASLGGYAYWNSSHDEFYPYTKYLGEDISKVKGDLEDDSLESIESLQDQAVVEIDGVEGHISYCYHEEDGEDDGISYKANEIIRITWKPEEDSSTDDSNKKLEDYEAVTEKAETVKARLISVYSRNYTEDESDYASMVFKEYAWNNNEEYDIKFNTVETEDEEEILIYTLNWYKK